MLQPKMYGSHLSHNFEKSRISIEEPTISIEKHFD